MEGKFIHMIGSIVMQLNQKPIVLYYNLKSDSGCDMVF